MTLECQWWFSNKASKRLKRLRPAFRQLQLVHEAYIQGELYMGRWADCGFWYRERSHTGFLAAAVWRAGGTALEEYGANKRGNSRSGRCDLYISIGTLHVECEAKHVWVDLHRRLHASVERLYSGLTRAIKDLKKLEGRRGLALCFATGLFLRSKASNREGRKMAHD